jgi:hypothetical protein
MIAGSISLCWRGQRVPPRVTPEPGKLTSYDWIADSRDVGNHLSTSRRRKATSSITTVLDIDCGTQISNNSGCRRRGSQEKKSKNDHDNRRYNPTLTTPQPAIMAVMGIMLWLCNIPNTVEVMAAIVVHAA